MDHELPLFLNGKNVGAVVRWEEGLHSVFSVRCRLGEGLRKAWLCGEGGGRLLIGTLVPENGWWSGRRVVRSSLEQQGLTGRLWGEVLAADRLPEGRTAWGESEVRTEDPVLADLFGRERRGRWKKTEEGWLVTFSWQPGQVFPWLPLFCFGRPAGGELLFRLEEDGKPVIGNKK